MGMQSMRVILLLLYVHINRAAQSMHTMLRRYVHYAMPQHTLHCMEITDGQMVGWCAFLYYYIKMARQKYKRIVELFIGSIQCSKLCVFCAIHFALSWSFRSSVFVYMSVFEFYVCCLLSLSLPLSLFFLSGFLHAKYCK